MQSANYSKTPGQLLRILELFVSFFYILLHLAEAEMILQNEQNLLEWPRGLPTVSSIDQARIDTDIEKRLHPPSQ